MGEEVGTFGSCSISLRGKPQHFQKCSNYQKFSDFQLQISEPRISYCYSTYVLANFSFPSTFLKAQEYFGCGWCCKTWFYLFLKQLCPYVQHDKLALYVLICLSLLRLKF